MKSPLKAEWFMNCHAQSVVKGRSVVPKRCPATIANVPVRYAPMTIRAILRVDLRDIRSLVSVSPGWNHWLRAPANNIGSMPPPRLRNLSRFTHRAFRYGRQTALSLVCTRTLAKDRSRNTSTEILESLRLWKGDRDISRAAFGRECTTRSVISLISVISSERLLRIIFREDRDLEIFIGRGGANISFKFPL
jgi:hypothetical protein